MKRINKEKQNHLEEDTAWDNKALKTLFNIMEEQFFFFLNFDVNAV